MFLWLCISDGCRFLLHRADGRVRVRRWVGERFQEDCVVGTVAHGGGSVHVRVQFIMEVVARTGHIAEQHQRRLLPGVETEVVLTLFGYTLTVIYSSNTTMALPHRARRVWDFLEREEIWSTGLATIFPSYEPHLTLLGCIGSKEKSSS